MLLFAAVVVKLGFVQGVRSIYYHKIAQNQYESRVPLRANRGMVYDRNGSLIISNNFGYSYAADPELLDSTDKKRIAEKFGAVFDKPIEFFTQKMNVKSQFVWLARNIGPKQSESLKDFNVYGLISLQEQQRLYPYGSAAGQVFGYANVDGKGASGIELEFDSILVGKDGYEIMQRDGIGRKMPSVDYPKIDPVPGCNLQLTIDMNIQQIVDEELAAGVESAKGSAGTAIFMNPNTGEILAVANYPKFDPSDYTRYSFDDSRDRAITDVFEPGSTFKVVTAASALEEGIERPNDVIFAENGKYFLYGKLIEDFERAGWVTFRRAVELSSNIAFSKIGMKIPPNSFYRYARDFGFGAPTGIELPGEAAGQLKKPYEWSKISEPFMSFGYEVMVTSLQMAQAYAAIANGGTLMKPYVVSRIVDARGNVLSQNSPVEIRRVVSPEVAQTLTGLFVDVVENGTGSPAKINDLLIAGKTGTSQKLVDGKYSKKFYHASFAGFFPVPNPVIVGFIMVDSPMNGYTGGSVAAPIFKKIASRIYGIMQRRTTDFLDNGVRMVSNTSSAFQQKPKDFTQNFVSNSERTNSTTAASTNLVKVPDVSYLDYASAKAIMENSGLAISDEGMGNSLIVLSERPNAGTLLPKGATVELNFVDARKISKMPDFRGASVRKATSFFLTAGIRFRVNGSGKIVSQAPDPGTPVNKKSIVVINCDDRNFNASGIF
ncbi:MAG TPA: penicillin-binding transpeptidase domain-containing protein [Candidatus Acidoferrales bacterium]|nr:penicillin-binding transpeptidase domain-containing protein [Candidatus Acidoferrales bacterium]